MDETATQDAQAQSGEPLAGACLCGAVRLTVRPKRLLVEICHCTMCRAWGGPLMSVPSAGHEVEGMENVTIYRSSQWAERAFCKQCGSNLWYHFLPAEHRSFQANLFDLPGHFVLGEQIFVDEKPHWYDFAQHTVMKTAEEVLAEAKAAGFEFD
jgi:hypothetical protein